MAGELDLLAGGPGAGLYVADDASVLNRATRKEVADKLARLEASTGYRLDVATVRKLEFENDAFAFGDKLVAKWFGKGDASDKSGVLVVVTTGKDGALTGGGAFMKAVGDELIDSVVGDNISILTEEEKYNEAVTSSVARIEAALTGKADPGPPVRANGERKRTYKTKEETQSVRGGRVGGGVAGVAEGAAGVAAVLCSAGVRAQRRALAEARQPPFLPPSPQKKPVTATIVVTLLVISVVVPMLQYFGYTNSDD